MGDWGRSARTATGASASAGASIWDTSPTAVCSMNWSLGGGNGDVAGRFNQCSKK